MLFAPLEPHEHLTEKAKMSAPDDEGNPWLSVLDLLSHGELVATLATAIEKYGIQTYDRFGRRFLAQKTEDKLADQQEQILNFLAAYRAEKLAVTRSGPFSALSDPDRWLNYHSPLESYGWPSDEAPNFREIVEESLPNSLQPHVRDLDGTVHTRTGRTYLVIIAALCKEARIAVGTPGASKRIRELTEKMGTPIGDDTIIKILHDIPEALESRMK